MKVTETELQTDVCKERAVAQIDRLIDEVARLRQQVKRMEFVARLNAETIAAMAEARRQERKEPERVPEFRTALSSRDVEG